MALKKLIKRLFPSLPGFQDIIQYHKNTNKPNLTVANSTDLPQIQVHFSTGICTTLSGEALSPCVIYISTYVSYTAHLKENEFPAIYTEENPAAIIVVEVSAHDWTK